MRQEVDLKAIGSPDVIFGGPEMTHRYFLKRPLLTLRHEVSRIRACLFIMLNPSRADAFRNDNTVSRCMKFATLWGFHQLWVANLFAYRTPYPGDLYEANDPIGDDNDFYISMAVRQADEVVVAYGNHGGYKDRASHVIDLIRYEGKQPKALGLTGSRHPIHPLARGKMWVPYETKLRDYESLLTA